MNVFNLIIFVLVLISGISGCSFDKAGQFVKNPFGGDFLLELKNKLKKQRSVNDVIETYGPRARKVMKAHFKKAKVAYPPEELVLIGLKNEEKLLIYARDKDDDFVKITEYAILGSSGVAGPKLKQGDCQMPEGFYRINAFNPNSSYHLSLRVNYPNEEDRAHALKDKRKKLGGDIMIHGKNVSIGCLAMGDEPIEEIFTLVYDTGRDSTRVILAPCDLTVKKPIIDMKTQPDWLPGLYKRLKAELNLYFKGQS